MMMLKPKIDPGITEIVARLKNAGFETYIVGGAVRDFLLSRTPKDYDISTAATPEQVRKVFHDRRTLIIGRRFRLVHLSHGRGVVEISTFRRSPRPDFQNDERPAKCVDAPENMIFHDNEYGTSEDDAQRRDFTVNSLFYDPVEDRIADFTGFGLADIQNGCIRIIGEDPELRFEEDPVRLLRALKLIGQYDFVMETATERALRKCMPLIQHASSSRMSLELEKILKGPYATQIFHAFREYGFLRYFLPAVDAVFDSPAMRFALDALEQRNTRVLEGLYRESLSLSVAILAFPFVRNEFDYGREENYPFFPGMESDFRHMIQTLFQPNVIVKRVCAAAIRSLMLFPRLRDPDAARRFASTKGYANAREMAIVLNPFLWNDPDFEERMPPSAEISYGDRPKRGRGTRRGGRGRREGNRRDGNSRDGGRGERRGNSSHGDAGPSFPSDVDFDSGFDNGN